MGEGNWRAWTRAVRGISRQAYATLNSAIQFGTVARGAAMMKGPAVWVLRGHAIKGGCWGAWKGPVSPPSRRANAPAQPRDQGDHLDGLPEPRWRGV